MKRILAILLVIAIVLSLPLSLASCKKKDKEEVQTTEKAENAKPEEPDQLTVTFNADGGKFTEGQAEYKTETEAVYSTFIPSAPVVEKDGFAFAGWFNGEAEYDETLTLTADVTYTAKWEKLYKVTFDADGGEFVEGAVTEYNVVENKTLGTAISIEPDANLNGYYVEGWYCGDVQFDLEYTVTEDMVFTAKWETLDGVMTAEKLQGKWQTTVNMMATLEASEIEGLPTGFKSDAKLTGYFEFDADKVSVYALKEDLIKAAGPYLEDLTEAMSKDVDFTYEALMVIYDVDTKEEVEAKVKADAGVPDWTPLKGKALQIAVVEYIKSVEPEALIGQILGSSDKYVLLKSVEYTVDPENFTIVIDGDAMTIGKIEEDSFKIVSAEGKCAGYKGATLVHK